MAKTRSNPADEAFERFAASGDQDALAVVFDATAPALYRVALHLRPSSWAAEDLVQSTFVIAIEKRARFQKGRGVFPWLIGILTNHARELQRRERYESLPSEGAHSRTPCDDAAVREAEACVEESIQALAEPYRTVVTHYVSRGRSPREISMLLGRDPNTVRSQLQRGLEFLRKRLPSGLAPGCAFLEWPERGLEDVRARVLEHALQPALATTASLWVLPLVLLGLVCGSFAVVGVLGTAEVGDMPAEVLAPPKLAVVGMEKGADSGVGSRQSVSAPVPSAARTRLVGRVVDARGRAGLADVPVRFTTMRDLLAQRRGGAQTITDADGAFALDVEPSDRAVGYQLQVGFGLVDRSPQRRNWDHLTRGATVQVGDVELAPGVCLSGAVAGDDGTPVRDATVRVDCDPPRYLKVVDGVFASRHPLPFGAWPFSVYGPGITPEERPPGVISSRANRWRITAKLKPSVAGIVLDSSGKPVAGVFVHALGEEQAVPARTDAEGRFQLFAPSSAVAPEPFTICARGWHVQRDSGQASVRWGDGGVGVYVERASKLSLQVTDAVSGAPVEAFALQSTPARRRSDGSFAPDVDATVGLGRPKVRLEGRHPRGRLLAGEVWRGWNLVTVIPTSHDYLVSQPEPVFVRPGATLEVRLRRTPRAGICVTDSSGTPLSGVRVVARDDVGKTRKPVRATTGARGRALLPAAGGSLRVRVAAKGFVSRELTVRADAECSVVLTRAGSVVGRLPVPTCIRRVELVPFGAGADHAKVRVGPSGVVRFSSIAPGSYRVRAWTECPLAEPGKFATQEVRLQSDLGVLRVVSGETTEVQWGERWARSGRIAGRVWLSGRRAPASWVYLRTVGRAPLRLGPFPVVDGAFTADGLVPRDYTVEWSRSGAVVAEQMQRIADPKVWNVQGGETTPIDLALEVRALTVTLTGIPAEDLRGLRLRLESPGNTAQTVVAGRGSAAFAAVPLGRGWLRIVGRPDLRVAPIEVTRGAGDMQIDRSVRRRSRASNGEPLPSRIR